MTGIAALAAAAAATQKIPGTTVSTNPQVSGIKVVTPTIVTPSGMKVTPVQNRTGNLFKLFEGVFFVFYILELSQTNLLWGPQLWLNTKFT